MPRDSLLSSKFFSSFNGVPELNTAFQEEDEALTALIKVKLYSQSNAEPIYYLGKHNDVKALYDFIKTADYAMLQTQLALIVEKLKLWGEQYGYKESETWADFLAKLKNPTEKTSLLYGDGKKTLEIIAVLLEDSTIDLEFRKTVFIQLVADNALAKCIDGCYTRIMNTADQLKNNRENVNQINHWIRSYATDIAKETAAQRPFAMPESYQSLVCRLLDISIETNELHASNYLLLEAKEAGFPINSPYDVGALEIDNKLRGPNRGRIVALYIKDLHDKMTASNLVTYITVRLAHYFDKISFSNNLSYMEKVSTIENTLNLLGLDSGFLLEESFYVDPFTLKSSDDLKITVERRLSQGGWFNIIPVEEIQVSFTRFYYYNFPGNMDLTWFWQEGENTRYRFLDVIQNKKEIDLNPYFKTKLFLALLKNSQFISNINDLDFILSNMSFYSSLSTLIPLDSIVKVIRESNDVLRFINIIKNLNQEIGATVLKKLGKSVVSTMLLSGFLKANVANRFIWPKESYLSDHYNALAKTDALKVTQNLIGQVLDKKFLDFRNIKFYHLKKVNYLNEINFSDCDLSQSHFFQAIEDCQFNNALLEKTTFYKKIKNTYFIHVDLRETRFLSESDTYFYNIALTKARLSTQSFEDLLKGGINNFRSSYLNEVNFQKIMAIKILALDLSDANLENTNLNKLDFSEIKLFGSNLKHSNLMETELNRNYLDSNVKIQGSKLTILSLYSNFYLVGVKNFDHCEIAQDIFFNDFYIRLKFESISFRNVRFIGHIFNLEFRSCDMTDTQFIAFPTLIAAHTQLVNLKFYKTQLVNTEFHKIRIIGDTIFSACVLHNIILDDVEIPVEVLFKFYQYGHRDFRGVKELKGKIPSRLPPFPLSEAHLSKEVFTHLYKQGLRDFRASNLHSFYLSETLTAQAISEISLKLEGAHYKQSFFSCSNQAREKRTLQLLNSKIPCIFYFIIQPKNAKGKQFFSTEDLLNTLNKDRSFHQKPIIKEVTIGPKPLAILKNPDEVHFYWAYQPDDEQLAKAIDFVRESIGQQYRKTIKLQFHFLKTLEINSEIKNFASDLYNLGFIKGQLNYHTKRGQNLALDIISKDIHTSDYSALNKKISASFQKKETIPMLSSAIKEKNKHAKLLRVLSAMNKKVKSGFYTSIRQGAHYDLGFALIHFVTTWTTYLNRPVIKDLDSHSKTQLKQFAELVINQESEKNKASAYQLRSAETIVEHCIERGECSSNELVKEDIMDTLRGLRPDIQVGYEYLFEKLKNFFIDIGAYFTEKFDEIKKSFQEVRPFRSEPSDWRPAKPLFDPVFFRETAFSKRRIYNWYDQLPLIKLIKDIQLIFDELDYDLNLDPYFSESQLAGVLYDFWLNLDYLGISGDLQPETILTILSQFDYRNTLFNKTFLIDSELLMVNREGNQLDQKNASAFQEIAFLNPAEVTEIKEDSRHKKRSTHLKSGQGEIVNHGYYTTSAADRPSNWFSHLVTYVTHRLDFLKIGTPILFTSSLFFEKIPVATDTSSPLFFPSDHNPALIVETHKPKNTADKDSRRPALSYNSTQFFNNTLLLAYYGMRSACPVRQSHSQGSLNHLKAANEEALHVFKKVEQLLKRVVKNNGLIMSVIYEGLLPYLKSYLVDEFIRQEGKPKRLRKSIFWLRNKLCQVLDHIQFPSARKWKLMNEFFTEIHASFPDISLKNKTYYPKDFLFFHVLLNNSIENKLDTMISSHASRT